MLYLLILTLLPALTLQQCLTADDGRISIDPNARQTLFKGQQQFSFNMLKKLNSINPSENIFFSPFSIYNALMIAYFVSSNHTEQSIKSVLNFPQDKDKINIMQAYRLEKFYQASKKYNGSANYELSSANKLFISSKLHVRDCIQELFEDELTPMDFRNNPQGSLQTINKWVSNQTKNQINDLLKSGDVTQATQLVLANAAYFKGVWKNKFLAENTKSAPFYISNSQEAQVTMMKQKTNLNHLVSEKLGANILELPYKGDDVVMMILLPPFNSPSAVSNILERLTPEAFKELVATDGLISRPVEVQFPKFKIEDETHLVGILESLGIGDLFKSTSDLSSLTGSSGLHLDEAIHKAKIKVDEEGTTASGATALFNFRSSRPLDPAQFICNHPFLYFLYDKTSQTILFAGVFNKPS